MPRPATRLLFSPSEPYSSNPQPSNPGEGNSIAKDSALESPAGPTNPGAAISSPPVWHTRRNSPTAPPSSPPSRSMEHSILSSGLPASPPGPSKLLPTSSSPSKAAVTSLTCSASEVPSSRWQTSSPLACLPSAPNSAPSSGSSRPTSRSSSIHSKSSRLFPRDTHTAATLAEKHDHRLKGRACTEPGKRQRIRHAIEIRHPSFVAPNSSASCAATTSLSSVPTPSSGPASWTSPQTFCTAVCTVQRSSTPANTAPKNSTNGQRASFCGPMARRSQTATTPARNPPRKRATRDVVVYFDNDAKVFAPKDAQALAQRVEKLLARKPPAPAPVSRYKHAANSPPPE